MIKPLNKKAQSNLVSLLKKNGLYSSGSFDTVHLLHTVYPMVGSAITRGGVEKFSISFMDEDNINRFIRWTFEDWKVRSFDRKNFDKRWEEWRESLAGKKPYEGGNKAELIKIGQQILKGMHDSYRLSQRFKADLKEFLEITGLTRGQLGRGH
jgi:hypothetical protein